MQAISLNRMRQKELGKSFDDIVRSLMMVRDARIEEKMSQIRCGEEK